MADGDIVNGIEHRVARFPEADRCHDVPIAVELNDPGVFGIVVGAPNSGENESIRIGIHAKDASCSSSVLDAGPLPFEFPEPVE